MAEREDGLCPVCSGAGHYLMQDRTGELTEYSWVFCWACNGTGIAETDSAGTWDLGTNSADD